MSQPTFAFAIKAINWSNRLQNARFLSTAMAGGQSTVTKTTRPQPIQPGSVPYRVGRSASHNLAVYHRIKAGGTSRTTEIKKIEGDVKILSEHLRTELNLDSQINTRTNIVVVKGFHKDKIISWLQGRGF